MKTVKINKPPKVTITILLILLLGMFGCGTLSKSHSDCPNNDLECRSKFYTKLIAEEKFDELEQECVLCDKNKSEHVKTNRESALKKMQHFINNGGGSLLKYQVKCSEDAMICIVNVYIDKDTLYEFSGKEFPFLEFNFVNKSFALSNYIPYLPPKRSQFSIENKN